MDIRIIPPTPAFEQCYRQYIVELGDEERYPMPMDLCHADFAGLIATLESFAAGHNLPAGLVPNSTFWLICNNQLAGVANLRHHLNPALAHAGGHIGIGIRPSFRRLGLGALLLAYTLQQAKDLHIKPVQVHCHADNLSSVALIKSCGGSLDSAEEVDGMLVQRYLFG